MGQLTLESCVSSLLFFQIGLIAVTSWEIDDGEVAYLLQEGTNVTSDSFQFSVRDVGENELPAQTFRLQWCYISLQTDVHLINETDGAVPVRLRRRGYLGETSFVSILVEGRTAVSGEDFHSSSVAQVQFSPGQGKATWSLHLQDDRHYEREEEVLLQLQDPVMAVLEDPAWATITIRDPEDEPTVFFTTALYEVEENSGVVLVDVQRTGDLSSEMLAQCLTENDTAVGTRPYDVQSYSDYISRLAGQQSTIKFVSGQQQAFCPVTLIDDSLLEPEEQFWVHLVHPLGGRLGQHSAQVIILPDINDVPLVYFDQAVYHVDEDVNQFGITVWRSGSDLNQSSSVLIRSKPSHPASAKVGYDYVGVSQTLHFAPGASQVEFQVTILDDQDEPRIEGPETFLLVLRMPTNAILGHPEKATVVINDSKLDLPMMQFEPQNYFVFEEVGQLRVPVWRTGDLRPSSSVRCYTRQGTAIAGTDFIERPNTNSSTIIFDEGYMKEFCILEIINDNKHEMDKTLTLVLGTPTCDSCDSAVVGPVNFTTITIMDSNDYPLIGFQKNRVVVNEPRMPISPVFVWIPVIRQGDLSQSAAVHVYTKDGSAKSGEDYIGKSAELEFHPNVSEVNFKVEILYSKEREITETFTVHLNSDLRSKVKITEDKFTVYIEEESIAMGLTFPAPPVVISLRDYANVSSSKGEIMAGYPLICVTACNPQHPEYKETASLCTEAFIVDTLTEYRWYISSSPDGIKGMRPITNQVFFASSRQLVLDSVFFSAGNTVQCGVRAVNSEGISGVQLMSKPVIISKVLGMCKPPSAAAIGAEPFSAKLRITGADDPNYPNMVKMSVEMRHRDGMFPAISTRPLADLELAISPHGVRVGTHKCSNLLNYDEVKTKNHIYNKNMTIFEYAEPELFQFSPLLRSPSTVGFYRNLNLQLCEWHFEYYYSLSELISDCGATVSPDYSRNSLVKSSLEVELPLYISYIYLARGLQYTDLSTKLRLVFTYDTTVMWQQGIGSSKNTHGGGWLYPKSMKINDDGQLVVHFQTEAKFNGLFVLSHLKSSAVSGVTSRKNKDLKCTLHLIKSSPTFAHPLQDWTFISNYAVQDYSGVFDVSLIPCEVEEGVSYSHSAPCSPQPPVTFELEVRFQQVSDPVPVEYSLDTQFYLSKQKDLWLMDSLDDFKDDWDTAYKKGDKIYGRLMIKSVQNLKDSFLLSIEKCFLCDGVDGYIPNFNPEKEEYGCIAPSPNLLHNFKIIDATSPSSCDESYDHMSFKAKLLKDDEEFSENENIDKLGSDGFSFSPDPLFQISPGKQWFIHCIYTLNSHHATGKQVMKRSVTDGLGNPSHHVVSPTRKDHVTKEYMGVGKNGKGTNLHHIELQYTPETSRYEYTPQYTPKRNVWFWWLAVVISTILVTLSVVVVICGCVVLNGKTRTDEAAGIVMCATVQCQKKERTSAEERTDV